MSFCTKIIKNTIVSFNKPLCLRTSIRSYPAPVKRFYKSVHVTESDGRYEICLDKRKLKTPNGNLLQLPNEALAIAVATEWDTQRDKIQQHNMHLTALSNTAIDNPCKQTSETITESMLQYLASDTLCFRSNEPPSFEALQREKWDPLLHWFQDRYRVKLKVCEDVSGIPVPDETLAEIKKQLLSYNFWCLLGINFTTENLKSLILTLAAINHVIDVEMAVALSRLETSFQIQHWGNVEWAHSVDEAQLKARVAAGVLFTYFNEGTTDLVEKGMNKKVSMIGKASP